MEAIQERQINNDDDERFFHLPHHWCLQSAIKPLLNWAQVHWLSEQPTDNSFDQNKNSRVYEHYCWFKVCPEKVNSDEFRGELNISTVTIH